MICLKSVLLLLASRYLLASDDTDDGPDVVYRRSLFQKFISEENGANTSENPNKEKPKSTTNDEERTKRLLEEEAERKRKLRAEMESPEFLKLQERAALFSRVRLPRVEHMKVGKEKRVTLPGGVEASVKVISTSPLIIEVENFLDEEDSDLLIELARAKQLKPTHQTFPQVELKNVEDTFKLWDYDQDGYVTAEEVRFLPGLADIKFSLQDVDDMFFVLKMDANKDGKVELDEMKNTDFSRAQKYFAELKKSDTRRRNVTSKAAWVWHDSDELLRFTDDGYFEQYHQRLESITNIPSIVHAESEPLQVKHFGETQFQALRQDSEPLSREVPCCMYGDANKTCRLCRYISFAIFLNDVDGGGEMAFPLANNPYQEIMKNSGEWRGYYVYAKTTGSRFYFSVDLQFSLESANRVVEGRGKDESGAFVFEKSILLDSTIMFEKRYVEGESTQIKYSGRVEGGSRVQGRWWVEGRKRLSGTFFMWNREYEIFSSRAVDEANLSEGCLKSSVVIQPKKGKAVFWYNHNLDSKNGMVGEINQEAMFGHCEVTKGEKYVAMSWTNVIGDGDLTLRAWRRGNNMLLSNQQRAVLLASLGTKEEKLAREPHEEPYFKDTESAAQANNTTNYYKHKPPSNSLQALQLLFNDMNTHQLAVIAKTVHQKLGLTCVNLDAKSGLFG